MFVRTIMIEDVTAVTPEDTLQRAYDLIQTKRYDSLPVLNGSTLVGIIQLTDIYEACMKAPHRADALGRPVKDVMTTNVVTVTPDDLIEQAAKILLQRDIPALPVVDEGRFRGIVTESDIFKTLCDVFGVDSSTVRLTLVVPEGKGKLARITEIIRDAGISITNLALFHSHVFDQYEVVIRVETAAHHPLVQLLEEHGFKVIHVSA